MSVPDRPDIERFRAGNAGVPFVWSFFSATPGPHVLVNALTHGNEPCGAVAVSRLLDMTLRPRCGRLTLSFANVEAYAAWRAGRDLPARYLDRDLNRLWRDDWIDADATSREAARARELRPVFAGADILLDLHSTAHTPRPFFVIADMPKTRRLADAMAWPPDQQLMPGGCIEGRHLIDYGRFSDPDDPAVAVTVECGRHDDAASASVALAAALRFLAVTGVLAPADAVPAPPPAGPLRRYRTVAPCVVRSDRFELLVPVDGFVDVRAGDVVALDGGEPVRAPFDATILAPRPDPARGTPAFIWSVATD